jgi:hypothetical protein
MNDRSGPEIWPRRPSAPRGRETRHLTLTLAPAERPPMQPPLEAPGRPSGLPTTGFTFSLAREGLCSGSGTYRIHTG